MTSALDTRVLERFRREFSLGDDVEQLMHRLVAEEAPLVDSAASVELAHRLRAEVVGWGQLETLLADPEITDILVNSGGEVFVERCGALHRTDIIVGDVEFGAVIERIVGPLGLRLDRSSPIVDGRLPDGSRVSAVLPPLAIDGPILTIRRFGQGVLSLDRFTDASTAAALAGLIGARCNVVVYGGTGSGKTTLLGALSRHIDPSDRILTIEDTAELSLMHPHVVRLEGRPHNGEGTGGVTIRELVRCALRLRPDRIIVGEVRGAEALDMVWAMSTGHDGSLSTCHANSADDALRRLETFMLMADAALPLEAIRNQLGAAVDVLVGVERGSDGSRRVASIDRVSVDGSALRTRPLRTQPATEVAALGEGQC